MTPEFRNLLVHLLCEIVDGEKTEYDEVKLDICKCGCVRMDHVGHFEACHTCVGCKRFTWLLSTSFRIPSLWKIINMAEKLDQMLPEEEKAELNQLSRLQEIWYDLGQRMVQGLAEEPVDLGGGVKI